jgi:hypothetical protein
MTFINFSPGMVLKLSLSCGKQLVPIILMKVTFFHVTHQVARSKNCIFGNEVIKLKINQSGNQSYR